MDLDHIKPGIYFDLPFDDYAASPGISQSSLSQLLVSPLHYRYGEKKETDALRVGSLVDAAVLSPREFVKTYKPVADDTRRNTKAWKEQMEPGRELVKRAEYDEALRIADAVHNHRVAGQLLAEGANQVSLYWIDEPTGLLCKGRPDSVIDNICLDLKTIHNANPHTLGKHIANFGYHRQQAMYRDGLVANGVLTIECHVLVFVEKKPPYPVVCRDLDAKALRQGEREIRHALALYDECRRENRWPGYSDYLETISLPLWALDEDLR